MNGRGITIGVFVLLLVILFFSGFFKPTGSAINDQDLLVDLDIPPDQQKINPGESLLLKISLRVPGGDIDQTSLVELEYSIREPNGNIVSAKKESGAIAVKESDVASLLVPTSTKPGVYLAFVKVTYQGNTYEGSKTFEVVNNKFNLTLILYILLGLIFLILLAFLIIKIRNRFYY
jgi:hypothetical protein